MTKEINNKALEIKRNYPMKQYTTIKVGGVANQLIYPATLDSFINLLNYLYKNGKNFFVLGAGSNTIIPDKGVKRLIISTRKLKKYSINQNDCTIKAECGVMLSSIMNNSIKLGLKGFGFAAGIPGTVGGGIYMNAGANGGEIKDCVKEVFIWNKGNEIKINREDINFEYRKSNLPKGSVVTKVIFQLEKGNSEELEKDVKTYLEYRNKTQPVKWANTGSVFKNPPEIKAGKLLEELKFKGYTIGGAKFSELHTNFIVNFDNAKANDVISLINEAKEKSYKIRNIKLETEVEIIDEG